MGHPLGVEEQLPVSSYECANTFRPKHGHSPRLLARNQKFDIIENQFQEERSGTNFSVVVPSSEEFKGL